MSVIYIVNKDTEHPIPDFNRTQLHVMQILWSADEGMKPAEIQDGFDWEIDNATLRSVLRGLVECGELTREQKGKAYFYSPAKKKQAALSTWFSGLAQIFASGSKASLLAQLLQDSSLSEEDRKELDEIANGK